MEVKFVVASKVEDHGDGRVEDLGDGGVEFSYNAGVKFLQIPRSNFLRRLGRIS
jgi:hypothetical protein